MAHTLLRFGSPLALNWTLADSLNWPHDRIMTMNKAWSSLFGEASHAGSRRDRDTENSRDEGRRMTGDAKRVKHDLRISHHEAPTTNLQPPTTFH